MGDEQEEPPFCSTHKFVIPQKAIKSIQDMGTWQKSEACLEYIGFIIALNEEIRGKPMSVDCVVSDIMRNLVTMLDELDKYIDKFPPIEQPQRFGNAAYREWFSNLKTQSITLLENALPEKYRVAIPEIRVYLIESFGNATRIDYGTGHEISFIMFLCCLYKIKALQTKDKVATVFLIFNRYLKLVRRLQTTYRMEPAGSHGVWSLDDYQFVPFIWGSSQLVGHPKIDPPKFLDDTVVEKFADEYMFISCIKYIKQVKTGLFAEHSNQLWGISAVPDWQKVNQGLVKMYRKEVLEKFPVVQHILFGSLLPITKFPIQPIKKTTEQNKQTQHKDI